MPSPIDRSTPVLPRVVWWLLLACAAVAAAVFLFGVSQRLGYPHELEWMEGAMVDHSARVAEGLPLYCAPGPEHVPFLYPPLLFWLGGMALKAGLPGLLALRLIAIAATVGVALLIGHWVRRVTGMVLPGLVAMGVFFAGYGWLAWWYDLARNDSLFVLLCLAAAYCVRHGGARRWLPAAVLATAAVLAKQSALMWLPAIGVGAWCHDRRNAMRFGTATLVGVAAAAVALHLASDGWSTFFVLAMPRQHGWDSSRQFAFWTIDLLPMLPLLGLGLLGCLVQWRAGRRSDALFLAAFGTGGLVTSWISRLHIGGFDNVMMYGFVGACVLGPSAAVAVPGRGLRLAVPLLLLAQFGWLGHAAWARRPAATLLPSAAHRRAHDELLAFVRAQPGPVWVPGHGGISRCAGKGSWAHGQAIFDLLQLLPRAADGMLDLDALVDRRKLVHLSPRAQDAIARFVDGVNAALREQRFAAIVVDEVGAGVFPLVFAAGLAGADHQSGTVDDPYVRREAALLSEPTALNPLLSYVIHSPYALVPRR